MPANVLIETYGCTLNQADSEIIKSLLEKEGFSLAKGEKDADVILLNTCTVKKATEQKILYRLSKLSKAQRKLVVTGCMARANFEQIEKYAPNASIIATNNVSKIGYVVENAIAGKKEVMLEYSRSDRLAFFAPAKSVIAKIPISEGCTSACTFCATKYARGPLNSFSETLILKAIENSVKNGSKEIELTSQDTGAYGIDRGTNIARLVENATMIEGDFRIRIGMLNPEHLHRFFDELVEAMKHEKVYKFLHLPVQSGSEKVLKDMRRRYSVDEFVSYVKEARSKLGATIATDIIVGYPTESDEDFEATLSLLKEIKPDVVNVSKFSVRPHTPAAKLKGLPNQVIKKRSVEASRLSRSIQYENRNALVGSSAKVLITELNAKSYSGRDQAYRQIAVLGNAELGSFVDVKIAANSSGCLLGILI